MPVATAEQLRGATRILVYGVTGSGKTTVADLLGGALNLPSHHVDDEIGWLPGWVERPADDQRLVSLTWLVRRTFLRWVTHEPTCNGNRESLSQILSRKSIIAWHFQSFTRKHDAIVALESSADGPPVVRLRRPRDLDRLLTALSVYQGM